MKNEAVEWFQRIRKEAMSGSDAVDFSLWVVRHIEDAERRQLFDSFPDTKPATPASTLVPTELLRDATSIAKLFCIRCEKLAETEALPLDCKGCDYEGLFDSLNALLPGDDCLTR